MTFTHPLLAICALAIVPAVYVAQRTAKLSGAQTAFGYSDLKFLTTALRAPAWPCLVLPASRTAGIALLTLAAAGPRLPETAAVNAAAIVICVDTSGSMRTADVKPTRGAAALGALRAFVAGLPSGTKIGVVAFAGTARVLALPAADRGVALEALTAMPEPNGQTALGDGLRAALHILPAAGARAIVLITDGTNNTGEDPARVVRDLQVAHITLSAIGVGENVRVERGLRSYAVATGGSYSRIGSAAQLADAFAHVAAARGHRRQARDVAQFPALAGLLFLSAAWLASRWAGRLSFLGEPELHEPLGHRDDAPQLRRAGRDGDRRRADRVPAHMD